MAKRKSLRQEPSTQEVSDKTIPILKGTPKKMERRKNIPNNKPKKRRIVEILKDPDMLGKIEDMATTGASLATMDAYLKFPMNTMSNLLTKGRQQKSGPYKEFFLLFRSWVAETRWEVESSLAKKSPERWLDRNTSSKIIESEEDRTLALSSQENDNTPKIAAKQVLESLKILREQGISIDEALDKDSVQIEDTSTGAGTIEGNK